MTKVIHKKLVDGEWVETIINDPPKFDWSKAKKKKKSKKLSKRQRRANKKRKITKQFYKTHEYARWRYEVFKRGKGKCVICGRSAADGVVLQADHIKPVHKYPELALDPSNGNITCSACNWGKWGSDDAGWIQSNREWVGLTPWG